MTSWDALSSTLNQEECNIVIADDASADDTQQRILDWHDALDAIQRTRVTLLLRSVNRGLPATLNEVLEQVHTPFFVYLAGDDWSMPGRIAKQADAMGDAGVGLSYGDALRADEYGRIYSETFYELHSHWAEFISTEDPFADMLIHGNWICAPTVMFRTEMLRAIGGFDENIAYEDHDSYTRIAKKGRLLYVDEGPLAVHREVATSLGGQLFHAGNLKWIEGQARVELKHLGVRPSLDATLAPRAFVRIASAAKLGADPQWVRQALQTVRPFLSARDRMASYLAVARRRRP
ncbi:glycosyltransferase family 2 protein [Ornithinimicrobium sp. Y1847]|uniref:glycosyltransferase family 2 protein n=1 Tax=Ornithinimicrobium sp. Y1847 TaxID=3405419 RepID=UPI003B67A08C